MIRLHRAMMVIFVGLLANQAIGQQCPPFIEETESLRAPVENWEAGAVVGTRLLVGLEIVEGDPKIRSLVVVAPFEDGKYERSWKFRGAVGTRLVWMRCIYENSEIRLVRRAEAQVRECRVTRTRTAVRNGRWIVEAGCT
jgi:hypothetical protein